MTYEPGQEEKWPAYSQEWWTFVENVKRGHVEGFRYNARGVWDELYARSRMVNRWSSMYQRPLPEIDSNHLCARIRSWIIGKGWMWTMNAGMIAVYLDRSAPGKSDVITFTCRQEGELERHIAAANRIIEWERSS